MARIKYIFSRPVCLFFLAILSGVILPQGAAIGATLTLPAMTIILTITLLRMPRGFFRHPGQLVWPALWGNILNYLILGNIIILPSIFLIREESLWVGMVVVAGVPPALSVITMSKLLHSESKLSFAGLSGAYLGALLIAPLIGIGFLKYIPLNYFGIIILLLEFIVLPLALSRLAVDKDWDNFFYPYKEIINDWCYFIILYSLVASSHDLIAANRPLDIVFILAIAASSTFLFGYFIGKIGVFYGASREKIISIILLATLKNYWLAGGIALTVFNKKAAIPALIFIIVMFFYEIWLKIKMKDRAAIPETEIINN